MRNNQSVQITDINSNEKKAVDWLKRMWLDEKTAAGWPYFDGERNIRKWGGTIDAIRGLIASGENRHSPHIQRSIQWLLTEQKDDGGWDSTKIPYSCTEVTAWSLIALRAAGEPFTSESIVKAAKFLMNMQKEDGSWSAYKGGISRVYPTIVAFLALAGLNDAAVEVGLEYLSMATNEDGGWGFTALDRKSNPAMTAMALYCISHTALIMGLQASKERKGQAIKWLYAHQNENFLWDSVHEEWVNNEDVQSGKLVTKTNHLSSAWAIMALLKSGESCVDDKLHGAIAAFCDMQNADGSVMINQYDINKYVWCAALYLCTIIETKNAILSTAYLQTQAEAIDKIQEVQELKDKSRRGYYIGIFNTFAIAVILMHIFSIPSLLARGAKWIVVVCTANLSNLVVGIVSSIVASIVVYFCVKAASRKKGQP